MSIELVQKVHFSFQFPTNPFRDAFCNTFAKDRYYLLFIQRSCSFLQILNNWLRLQLADPCEHSKQNLYNSISVRDLESLQQSECWNKFCTKREEQNS